MVKTNDIINLISPLLSDDICDFFPCQNIIQIKQIKYASEL